MVKLMHETGVIATQPGIHLDDEGLLPIKTLCSVPLDEAVAVLPVAFAQLFKTECDWGYYTEPQPHLNNRRLFWPRGKMLGGTSSHNAMVYIRGHRSTYDRWATDGNVGWGYADVLPTFKKSQHQERGASDYHGVGGPLNVADQRDTNPCPVPLWMPVSNGGLHGMTTLMGQGKRASATTR